MLVNILKSMGSRITRIFKSNTGSTNKGLFNTGSSSGGAVSELEDAAAGHYNAYRKVVWIRRSIDLRAANCASVPLRLYEFKKEVNKSKMGKRRILKCLLNASRQDETKIEKAIMKQLISVDTHDLLDLLADVNPFSMNRSDLWRQTEQNVQIYGQAFWYLEDLGSNQPREIYMLPNKCVTVHAGKTAGVFIDRYEYKPDGGDAINYPPGKIIHFRLTDPDCPFQGLSPQSSTMQNSNSYLAANRWNYVWFNNAMKPVGFIEIPEGEEVDEDTITMIRQAVNSVHGGVERVGTMGVLSGGAKFNPTMQDAKDADWRGLGKDNREVFCASHGVPLFLVSSHDAAHFATAKQAEESFWTDTIIPQLRWYEEVLFWDFLPTFKGTENMVLRFDLSEVPALESINSSKAERIQKSTGVATKTPNEGRAMMGDTPLGSDGDQLFGTANQVPLFSKDGE